MADPQRDQDDPEVDPVEFLRAALAIKPEDAAEVRKDAAEKMKPAEHRSDDPDE